MSLCCVANVHSVALDPETSQAVNPRDVVVDSNKPGAGRPRPQSHEKRALPAAEIHQAPDFLDSPCHDAELPSLGEVGEVGREFGVELGTTRPGGRKVLQPAPGALV